MQPFRASLSSLGSAATRARAAFDACKKAIMTHGGMGYAKEYQVERLFRESMRPVITPVTEQMILSYIAENVLHLPKSY